MVSVPIETVDSYVKKLTDEFLQAEYFDQQNFPKAMFKSSKVVSTGDNTFDVHGQLTIKGVSKQVVMHATLNKVGTHPMTQKPAIGFDAHTTINRSEFGLGKYVPNVSDEVTLTLTTEAQAD